MLCIVLDILKQPCPERTMKSGLTRVSITVRVARVLKNAFSSSEGPQALQITHFW